MEVKIRLASTKDKDTVFLLLKELASEIYNMPKEGAFKLYNRLYNVVKEYNRRIERPSHNYRIYVLEVKGKVVGLASVIKVGRCLYIDDLVIKKEYRSRGYGRTLVKYLEKIYRDCDYVEVDTHKKAVEFFRKLGFTEVYKFNREITWIKMIKILQ